MGSALDFDFCYGPAFGMTPEEVKEVAAGLAAEPWAHEALGVDDDENLPGLLRFFAEAAAEGKGLVGGVS
jgi:hypothetical protein